MEFVYFILDSWGCIKIGTSENPWQRLEQIRTSHSQEVALVAVIPNAGRAKERELHQRFRKAQLNREWFIPQGPLVALIDLLRMQSGQSPLWKNVAHPLLESNKTTMDRICVLDEERVVQ